MITAENIKAANKQINGVPVKGKNYALVAERVRAFRDICPAGCIDTEIISDDGNRVVMRATVSDENGRLLGTGIASEVADSTYINKTSHYENCQTSAVGRALGNCGIGIDLDGFASAEEVANAELNSHGGGSRNRVTEKQVKALETLYKKHGVPVKTVCDTYGVKTLSELPFKVARDEYNRMTEKDFKREYKGETK